MSSNQSGIGNLITAGVEFFGDGGCDSGLESTMRRDGPADTGLERVLADGFFAGLALAVGLFADLGIDFFELREPRELSLVVFVAAAGFFFAAVFFTIVHRFPRCDFRR